jgi:hypothetical protein
MAHRPAAMQAPMGRALSTVESVRVIASPVCSLPPFPGPDCERRRREGDTRMVNAGLA